MTTKIERIACFVDGFNLYHAIHDLGEPPLKWLDIRALCGRYAAQDHQHIVAVHYFSAYATWLPDAYRRHRAFVRALVETGVKPVMGVFKDKTRTCRKCRCSLPVHEEKQTDVNIGLHMLKGAFADEYDHAFLLSNDSDLTPVVNMVKDLFPEKRVRILTPPKRRTSKELMQAAGGVKFVRSIKAVHLRQHLLPREVCDFEGRPVAIRPQEYEPSGESPRAEGSLAKAASGD